MKLGKEMAPNYISQQRDRSTEKAFGKALEAFELECDELSNDIEMEKKEVSFNFCTIYPFYCELSKSS